MVIDFTYFGTDYVLTVVHRDVYIDVKVSTGKGAKSKEKFYMLINKKVCTLEETYLGLLKDKFNIHGISLNDDEMKELFKGTFKPNRLEIKKRSFSLD